MPRGLRRLGLESWCIELVRDGVPDFLLIFVGSETLHVSSGRWRGGKWRSVDRVDATRGHVSIQYYIVHQPTY